MKILTALLSHQPAACVERMVEAWGEHTLILYGGSREEFGAIRWNKSVFIEDPRLRTTNHRLERQSYTEVFRRIAEYAEGYSHVLFGEYDLVPLAPIRKIHNAYWERLEAEKADALFPLLFEVQDTCQEIWLPYRDHPDFWRFLTELSKRPDLRSVLWALFPGSFWKVEVIAGMVKFPEPFPIYFEIFLPTLAHHLGFRLRPLQDPRFAIFGGKALDRVLNSLDSGGALVAHPVKSIWS